MPSIRLPLEDKFHKTVRYMDGSRERSRSGWEDTVKGFSGEFLYGTIAKGAKMWMSLTGVVEDNYTEPSFEVGDRNTLLSFSKELSDLIPENTYLKSIKVYLYLQTNKGLGYVSSPADLALSLQKGEPESPYYGGKLYNEKFKKHEFKDGWNEINFTEDFVDQEAKFRSLNIKIFARSIHLERYEFSSQKYLHITPSEIRNSLIKYNGFDKPNSPYAIVEYAYNKPQNADSMAPSNKVANPRTPIRFSWNTKAEQTEFELSYKVNNGSYKTISKSSVDRFYILPADTIKEKSGTVTWRVRFKDESGTYSEYQIATFEIGVPDQEPPRIIYPAGAYIKNTEKIDFNWSFVADTIEKQKSFELQYKIGNLEWQTVKKATDSTHYTLENLQKYGTDTGQWKVRVTNIYGQESEWSEIAKFQLYGVPPIPQITSVSNKNYPTINWYSDQQEMFKVTILDKENNLVYDSNYILDYTAKEYRVPKVINNGKYTFTVTIKNKYGIESEEAKLTQIIDIVNNRKVDFEIYKSNYHLEIISKNLKFKVLRNGKLIGKTDTGVFKDYTCANGIKYKYQIMTEIEDEVCFSENKNAKIDFKGCTIATVNRLSDLLILRYNVGDMPGRTFEFSIDAHEIEIEGSKYPYIEYGDIVADQRSYNFFIKEKDKFERMLERKEEFLIRDFYGENICGSIKNIGLKRNQFGYELSFTILRTSDDYE